MNCPVCKRELAPTLSICLTCGTMMHDTVREELKTKVGKITSSELPAVTIVEEIEPVSVKIDPPPMAPREKSLTSELVKKNTSPTLVDFQHKNPTLPEWRIELQNAIRKRNANGAYSNMEAAAKPVPVALQPEPQVAVTSSSILKNKKVANALDRIERSRKTFAAVGTAAAPAKAPAQRTPVLTNRSFPFNVVERTTTAPKPSVQKPLTVEIPKPKLVTPLRIEKKKFDTNKLPPIPEPESPLTEVVESANELLDPTPAVETSFSRLSIPKATEDTAVSIKPEIEMEDEIDDLAPLSMRFGAAVFDLIIGGFAAAFLMSPFLLSNANIASLSGFLAVVGAALVVMFVYRTASIAFLGRTFGMRLFSIEIIDAEENQLPSLHQAAVSSAVYLLSLLFLGIGFAPAFFNEERRTLHDMLSGTLLIREY